VERGAELLVSLLGGEFAKNERACEYLFRLLTELVRGDFAAAKGMRRDLQALGADKVVKAAASNHVQSQGHVLVNALDVLQHLADQ